MSGYGRGGSRPPPTYSNNNSYDRQDQQQQRNHQQFSTAQSTDSNDFQQRRDPPNSSSNNYDRRGPPPSGYDRRPPPESNDRRPPPSDSRRPPENYDRQDRNRRFDESVNGPDYRDFGGRSQGTRDPPPRTNDGTDFRTSYPRGPPQDRSAPYSRNDFSNDVRQNRNNPPPRIIADPRSDEYGRSPRPDNGDDYNVPRSPRPANEQFSRSSGGGQQTSSVRGAINSGGGPAPPRAPYDITPQNNENRYSRDSRPDNGYGSRGGGGGYDSGAPSQRGGYSNGPERDQQQYGDDRSGRDQRGGYDRGRRDQNNSGGGRDQESSAFSGRGTYAPRNDQDRGYPPSRGQDADRGYGSTRGQDNRAPPPTRGGFGGGPGRDQQGGYNASRDNDNAPHDYNRFPDNNRPTRGGGGAAAGGYETRSTRGGAMGGGYDRPPANNEDRGYQGRQENGYPLSTRGGRAPYGGGDDRQNNSRPYNSSSNNREDSSYDYSNRQSNPPPPSNNGYGNDRDGGGGYIPPSTRGSFGGGGSGRGGGFNASGGTSRYQDRREDNNGGYGSGGGGYSGLNNSGGGGGGYGGLSASGYGGLHSLQFDDGRKERTAENHAPRDYKPVERNVEDIFEEDKEDVKKNTATIFDADADVTVEEAADDMNCETWAEMNLHDSIMENIRNSDYIKPRKIQARTIPYVLEGYDVKCQGETGSGKTAAFLIPVIQKLIEENEQGQLTKDGPICLIVAPTRELVSQIYEQALKFTYKTGITVARAYGEYNMHVNRADIRRGCNILCACIGRLMHFIEEGDVKLDFLKFLILDEADRMLMERNNSDIMRLFNNPELPTKDNLQMLLFSATLRDPIVMELTKSYMKPDKCVLITATCQSNKRVNYQVFAVPSAPAKFKYLVKYLKKIQAENDGVIPRTLIFVNKKINTDRVAMECTMNGFPATTIHGDRGQHLREEALAHFRSGKTCCLVATDVCARGVDIKEMDHVINYDMPTDKDGFIQRSGRTGRTHNGTAMSFYYEADDRSMATDIARIIQQNGQEAPAFLDSYVQESDYNFGEPDENGDGAGAGEEDEGYQNGDSYNNRGNDNGYGNSSSNGYGSSNNGGYGGTTAPPGSSPQPQQESSSAASATAPSNPTTVAAGNDDDDWD